MGNAWAEASTPARLIETVPAIFFFTYFVGWSVIYKEKSTLMEMEQAHDWGASTAGAVGPVNQPRTSRKRAAGPHS